MEDTLWKAKVAFQTKFHCFAGMGANTRQSCETQWSQSIGLSAAMEKKLQLCVCACQKLLGYPCAMVCVTLLQRFNSLVAFHGPCLNVPGCFSSAEFTAMLL